MDGYVCSMRVGIKVLEVHTDPNFSVELIVQPACSSGMSVPTTRLHYCKSVIQNMQNRCR